ncbi:uncharacterized protein F4822DRAFT_203632 [Hypoxylon trugodes]|uniref:uncharacterized protein n=1 Tax=Hypoxylon trugodes TaxID=326681 RepID=UPI002197A9D0|nr:uncharacterized protein F4822DRAFT_203632 [Hypoxylon trugodes]KAI1389530.1 hypothetical protein F4822DRAFT_203632 [Hypoxylon trugodes]
MSPVVKKLAGIITQAAKPSMDILNDSQNHIPIGDLHWLIHTVAYERWVNRRALSSTLWCQSSRDTRRVGRDTLAASIAQLLPYAYIPFTTHGNDSESDISRALYYQCLPAFSSGPSATKAQESKVTANEVMVSLICQAFLLDCSEPSVLEERLMRMGSCEREFLNFAISDPRLSKVGRLGELLLVVVASCGQPACIAIDNLHALGEAEQTALARTIMQLFDKRVQSAHRDVPLILTGTISRQVSTILEEVQQVDEHTEHRECIESLHFPEWNTRREQVEKADEGTTWWVWKSQKYKNWAQANRGLLWIDGKPGSGKSVLARSMLHRLKAKSSAIVAGRFYSTRLGDVGTSDISLLRSIIYELLSECPALFRTVVKHYRKHQVAKDERYEGVSWSWCSSEDFLRIGQQILEDVSATNKPIICIVDAMDLKKPVSASTCQNNGCFRSAKATTLLRTFSRLVTDVKYSKMKFIAFSRPEPSLEVDFVRIRRASPSVFRITLEQENAGDIGLVINRGLWALVESMHRYDSEEELNTQVGRQKKRGQEGFGRPFGNVQTSGWNTLWRMRQYMIDNARGVFLWVSLILKDLEDTVDNGIVTLTELESRLRSLPFELDEFYDRVTSDLCSRLSPEGLQKSRKILMLISGFGAFGRTLTIRELWEALVVPEDVSITSYSASKPLATDSIMKNSWNDFRRQLNRQCGHFIEVISQNEVSDPNDSSVGPDDVVHFIHRTVNDFLGTLDCTHYFSISEAESRSEVRDFAARYVRMVIPTQEEPGYQKFPNGGWMDIELFVDFMEQQTLFNFAVAVLSIDPTPDTSIRLKISGTIRDQGEPSPDGDDCFPHISVWIAGASYPDSLGGDNEVDSLRRLILGHAVYYACREGYVTAIKNLYFLYNIVYPHYTHDNRRAIRGGASRAKREARIDERNEPTENPEPRYAHRRSDERTLENLDRIRECIDFIELSQTGGDIDSALPSLAQWLAITSAPSLQSKRQPLSSRLGLRCLSLKVLLSKSRRALGRKKVHHRSNSMDSL